MFSSAMVVVALKQLSIHCDIWMKHLGTDLSVDRDQKLRRKDF